MLLASSAQTSLSIGFIEGSLTLVAAAIAFAWPTLGASRFARIERVFCKLSKRKTLSVFLVGLSVIVLRLALLPVRPIPLPFVPDDFSFLLAADTFAHGRLTNPTPAMWVHFESFHIDMKPTYMSMYFPGPGLVLAAGKVLFGHPWFGLLIANALMCAAICWMLQAWLPPTWALLGGILAIVRISLFSYWIDTYFGGGAIAALGGALVLGALPRFIQRTKARDAILMAVGIMLLAYTRPYEGMLLCLPVAIALGRWLWDAQNRPSLSVIFRRTALPLLLLVAAAAWLGYYDYRAFGNPLTLPYTVNRATYAMAPYFIWQTPRPEPVYRNETMRNFYNFELDDFNHTRSIGGMLSQTVIKLARAILFFAGIGLIPPIFMLRRALIDRRIQFLTLCIFTMIAGTAISVFMLPHYLAPFTAVFYAIGLQATRHLRVWRPEGRAMGLALVRASLSICLIVACLRVFDCPLKIPIPEWGDSIWNGEWYGPDHFGTDRAMLEQELSSLPGKQLVLVRYLPNHWPYDEWVYNAADINDSKVIWARAMDPTNDEELIKYYKDRHVWLVEPDTQPVKVTPYPSAMQRTSAYQ